MVRQGFFNRAALLGLLWVAAGSGALLIPAHADLTSEQDLAPLPLAAESKIEEPPQTTGCGANWKTGYTQALGGQFIFLSMTKNIPAEKRACEGFRKSHATDAETHDLECCLAGYRKGLPALKDMIAELQNRKLQNITSPPLDPREQQCLKEFKLGRAASETYCRKLLGVERVCEVLKTDAAYPACFNLGFFLAADHCDFGEGKQIHDYLKTQRLYDSRNIKNFNDAPFDFQELKSEAGRADAPFPSGSSGEKSP